MIVPVRLVDDEVGEVNRTEEAEKEGGNVMQSSPVFYGPRRIAVFDFKILYPSIVIDHFGAPPRYGHVAAD